MKKMYKNIFTFLTLMLLIVLAACSDKDTTTNEADSSDYPTEKIEIITPFPAGGVTDTLARAIAKELPDKLPNDVQVLVENQPLGGAGSIGTNKVIASNPDGYTVGLTPISTLSVQQHINDVGYTHEDVTPLIEISSSEGLLVVDAEAPYDDFDEWLDYVKENPGDFHYSTAGSGSTQHIQAEALSAAEDLEIEHVPYDGTAESTTALLGGHVDGAIMQTSQALEYVEEDEFKVLAIFGTSKPEAFEDVPLLTELDVDVEMDNFNLIFGPPEMDTEVQEILSDALAETLDEPKVVEIIENMNDTPQSTVGEELLNKVDETSTSSGEVIEQTDLNDD